MIQELPAGPTGPPTAAQVEMQCPECPTKFWSCLSQNVVVNAVSHLSFCIEVEGVQGI